MKHKTCFWIGIVLIVCGHIGVIASATNPEEVTAWSLFLIVVFFGGGVLLAVRNHQLIPRAMPLLPQPMQPPPAVTQTPQKANTSRRYFAPPQPKDGIVLWDSRVIKRPSYDKSNIYTGGGIQSTLFLEFGEHYVGVGYAKLAPEPDNYYDSEAIALWFKGEPIGYLPTEHREYAAKLLKRNPDVGFYLPLLITVQPFYYYDDDGVAIQDSTADVWAFSNEEDWCKFTLRFVDELDVGISRF